MHDDSTASTGNQGGPARPAADDDLLALSAHELRSPVAAIVGYAETIRTRSARLSQLELEEALDSIVRQAHRLDALLQDILLLAAGRAGMLPLQADAVPVLDALAEVLRDEAVDPGSIAISCDPAAVVHVDRGRFHQMVANFVNNARLHGRPPFAIEVTVGGGFVEVAVLDGGPGVAKQHVASLFERFVRGGADPSASGSGLGLAVVRTLAEASGGSARYEPERHVGAHAFVLALPAGP
jgi:signal transduction histidine kinase